MEKYNLTQTGPEVQEILDNATPQSELTTETQRAQLAEQTLQGNIDAEAQARANAISTETQRAQLAEQTLQTHIDNEALTRENADTLLQTNIGAEETRAKAAEKQNADDIDALEALLPSGVSQSNKLVAQQALEAIIALIPSAASALNQLADKAFVNSSIATNTATFRGTFNLVSDIHLPIDANHETIALNLLTVTPTADNNDYCFVQIPDSAETPAVIASTDRYKFNGTEWDFEYTLNTSGFTTAQWEAINSGITAAILESLTGIPALIPSEATDQNQLADKAYVLTQILLATPAFKGQFTTLTQLQAVTGAKYGDLGIVRTKDTDGHDVFIFYQYKNDQWTYFYSLSYHPQDKPATTGLVGEAPYNGMGRVELPMNWVEGWPNDTWLYYPYNDIVYLMYYWNGLLYAPYNSGTQEGLGLDDNLVVKPLDYNIADIEQFVGQRYLPFTESSGVWTITKPDDSTITSTELNNTNIYKINDPTHLGINVLTQAMINRPNTIYVIQHDYTLGEDITIPANCVLEFDGGSISGAHTLTGNNTGINAGLVKIFNTDVTLAGTWNIAEAYPEWFGAKADNTTDSTLPIQKCVDFASIASSIARLSKGTYLIYDSTHWKGIIPRSNTIVVGSGDTVMKMMSRRCNIFSNMVWYFLDGGYQEGMSGIKNVVFSNIIFDGNASELGDPYDGEGESPAGDNFSYGIYLMKCENILIERCTFKNFVYGGHNLWACQKQKVVDSYYTAIGIYDAHFGNYAAMGSDGNAGYPSGDVYYGNNIVDNCGGGLRCNAGGNWGTTVENCNFTIENNSFKNCLGGLGLFMGNFTKIVISNNYFFNILRPLLIDPMAAAGANAKLEGVYVENNVFESDDNLVLPSGNNRSTIMVEAIPYFVFRNNAMNYKKWNYFPFMQISLGTAYDEYYSAVKRSVVFENNSFTLPGCSHFMMFTGGKDLYFVRNTIKMGYFNGNLFNFIAENNDVNIFAFQNNFEDVDMSKLFTYEPSHAEFDGNLGYLTKGLKTVNISDYSVVEFPFIPEKIFAQIQGPYYLDFSRLESNYKQYRFRIHNLDGTVVTDNYDINIQYYRKYYDFTRS